jgi:hypothetical protein
MTRQRLDGHSTEFGLWLRGQLPDQKTDVRCIDSVLGFVTTNLDYVWHNYKTRPWMAIEEKRYQADVSFSQDSIFRLVNEAFKSDVQYHGLHILRFEKTNPEDGRMWLNGKMLTTEQLLAFLRFDRG